MEGVHSQFGQIDVDNYSSFQSIYEEHRVENEGKSTSIKDLDDDIDDEWNDDEATQILNSLTLDTLPSLPASRNLTLGQPALRFRNRSRLDFTQDSNEVNQNQDRKPSRGNSNNNNNSNNVKEITSSLHTQHIFSRIKLSEGEKNKQTNLEELDDIPTFTENGAHPKELEENDGTRRISLNDLLEKLRKQEIDDNDINFDNVRWSSSDSQLQPIPIFVKTFNGSLLQLQISLEDSVQVIHQSLGEAPEACYITLYYLEVEGVKVDEYTTLSEIANLQPHTTFTMIEAPYDEKSARIHVKVLRDILSSGSKLDLPNSCLFPYYSIKADDSKAAQGTKKDHESLLPLVDTSLSSFFPNNRVVIECLKSIGFSGWNPPPGNRKLLGDLFYLEIELLENKKVFVTSCPDGFFVNESNLTKFNPKPLSKYTQRYTLVELLNDISPMFRKNFDTLLANRLEKDPFQIYPVPFPVRSWLGQPKEHTYDLNRSDDTHLSSLETDGQFRDWNEEFQSSKELPRSSIRERIIRDHAIIKVNNDFVEAATKGAIAIINKTVAPLNPMDSKPVQMYIYNNIFFSYAIDTPDRYEEVEGRYTYASANNDLKGVIAYNNTLVSGLYTLATAIIDYRGYRMVAQSMIPGIFNPSTTVYTSSDLDNESEFKRLLSEASEVLHIPEHEIIDKSGKSFSLRCSVPTKGIIGTDGRRYIIDLCRVTPQDANYKGTKSVMAILRPELLMILNDAPTSTLEDKDIPFKHVKLNPDVYAGPTLGGNGEQRQKDEELVDNAASFLKEFLIPNMIQEFSTMVSVPVDGQTLTSLMHHRGVNMRYLGYIASLTTASPFIHELVVREIIVRTAKHILRGILFETNLSDLAPTISHFLNCFLGGNGKAPAKAPPTNASKKKKKKKPQAQTKIRGIVSSMSQSSLWKLIQKGAQNRFQYELPPETRNTLCKIATLRNFAQKIGIKIAQNEYDFTSETPFQVDDILDIHPVVKHILPKTQDGHDLLEAGVAYLSQGRLDIAFELLSEALVIFSQVYGPMHQATAICFSNMAMVLYQSGDPAEASIYQQKAVIINERVQGLDHHETAQSYGNLALFCHKMGKVKLALNYIQRALYLGYLACGLNHPDNGTSFTNIGMILQDLGDIHSSLVYFLKALDCNEGLANTEEQMLLTAAICHAIAVDYSMLEYYKEALDYEKRNYSLLSKVLGNGDEKDPRLEESNQLLKQYTAKAVEQQQLHKQFKIDFLDRRLDQRRGSNSN